MKQYRIVITALEPNEQYKEQLLEWEARRSFQNYGPNSDMPRAHETVTQLESVISERQFEAVRQALIKEFSIE